MVSAQDFIPVAESSGLIVPFGEWILRRACTDAMAWPDDIQIAVNLSAVGVALASRGATVAAWGEVDDAGLGPWAARICRS